MIFTAAAARPFGRAYVLRGRGACCSCCCCRHELNCVCIASYVAVCCLLVPQRPPEWGSGGACFGCVCRRMPCVVRQQQSSGLAGERPPYQWRCRSYLPAYLPVLEWGSSRWCGRARVPAHGARRGGSCQRVALGMQAAGYAPQELQRPCRSLAVGATGRTFNPTSSVLCFTAIRAQRCFSMPRVTPSGPPAIGQAP